MGQDIKLTNLTEINEMVISLGSVNKMSLRTVEDKNLLVSETGRGLLEQRSKLKSAINELGKKHQEWYSKIYSTDSDGNSKKDAHAEMMANEAKRKIQECYESLNGMEYHLQTINDLNKVPVFQRIISGCSPAIASLLSYKKQIESYEAAGNVGSVFLPTSLDPIKKSEKNEDAKFKAVEFSGRKVMSRDIDWNYVHDGKSNLERTMAGNSPYDSAGNRIVLHHIGQNVNGTLVEVPSNLHNSKKYNLHGTYHGWKSFRNDSSLEHEYNHFRSSYWQFRARDYLDG